MTSLTPDRIASLLTPYLAANKGTVCQTEVPAELFERLSIYLELLLRWNARTNLTAIRDPERIVERHFGESLFAGCVLAAKLPQEATLLDLGSGAGFPGLPIQLLLPGLRVTLAESQGKKAAFLREVVRTLGISTEVWDQRIEQMPEARRFDCVTLRAVDQMDTAKQLARLRLAEGGWLAVLETRSSATVESHSVAIPGRTEGVLTLSQKPTAD